MSVALAAVTPAFAQRTPGKDKVKLARYVFEGNGCPRDGELEVEAYSSTTYGGIDRLHVSFADMIVEQPGQDRAICTISFDFRYPRGWQYRLAKADVRGFGLIQPGVTSHVEVLAVTAGGRIKKNERKRKGYWEGEYAITERFGEDTYSRCGAVDYLDMRVIATLRGRGDEESFLKVDGTTKGDGDFVIEWRRCR